MYIPESESPWKTKWLTTSELPTSCRFLAWAAGQGEAEGAKARQIPPLLFDALPPGRPDFVHKESLQLMANSFSDRSMHVSIYTLVL